MPFSFERKAYRKYGGEKEQIMLKKIARSLVGLEPRVLKEVRGVVANLRDIRQESRQRSD